MDLTCRSIPLLFAGSASGHGLGDPRSGLGVVAAGTSRPAAGMPARRRLFALTYNGRVVLHASRARGRSAPRSAERAPAARQGPWAVPRPVPTAHATRRSGVRRCRISWCRRRLRLADRHGTQREFQELLIDGLAGAALEQRPGPGRHHESWLARRRRHIESGRSRAVVGHRDLGGLARRRAEADEHHGAIRRGAGSAVLRPSRPRAFVALRPGRRRGNRSIGRSGGPGVTGPHAVVPLRRGPLVELVSWPCRPCPAPPPHVVDLGCGVGGSLAYLAARVRDARNGHHAQPGAGSARGGAHRSGRPRRPRHVSRGRLQPAAGGRARRPIWPLPSSRSCTGPRRRRSSPSAAR